ncbi:hypothetical protein GKE82_12875 [Conexibacter sp. W3-3-2]|uniref:DNA glycosylase AlkZ-like family protein n=1 Tax=Conexibacter sp. W3-3-2 TaxID=2675227 RepID=UPI0012B81E74|nr:crosslink repair DNA glycosylase YcaQ family protein [Conexibacter sp. W3-3-2]MTD45161.1 hypothetical protein [Conexibacter sp. W3-3-2]
MAQIPEIPAALARRMALHAQGLGAQTPAGWGPRDGDGAARIARVVQRIGCLQLDPVSTVARSPLLVLHARLGAIDEAALHEAAYGRRALFEYWCHEASLCWTGDLPFHRHRMRRWLAQSSPRAARARAFLAENAAFARSVVRTLRQAGPLPAAALEDRSAAPWRHGHWTDEVSGRQTVARMLDLLWLTGKVGVADRGPSPTATSARRWDLLERCLPDDLTDVAPIPSSRITRRAVERAVGMLGVARGPDVRAHFTRNRYDDLPGTLAALSGPRGPLTAVAVRGDDGELLRGPWYARREDLATASALEPGTRRLALSPFDNVLCDRARTATLFGFDHRLEIYVPPPKRRWGYYVLPILDGERLVARADAAHDRESGVLRVHTLHLEDRGARGAAQEALNALARLRGARDVRIERVA